MATLLTNDEITLLQESIQTHFDTFTSDRSRLIIIHKEPLKTLSSVPTNPLYFYQNSNPPSYTYTPVTGIYPAMLNYTPIQQQKELDEIKVNVGAGAVKVKVEQEARDFIEDGRKNIKVVFDGNTYNFISSEGLQHFAGKKFYIYQLKNTT